MPVTQQDVIWCYRSILARDPPSPDIVKRRSASTRDFRKLVLDFCGSQEFKQRKSPRAFVPLQEGQSDIELTASGADLSLLMQRCAEAWSQPTPTEPAEAGNKESESRLHERALRQIESIDAILKRHGFSQPESKVCLQYGSDQGAVALPLSRKFKTVHGYTTSQSDIDTAAKRASQSGFENLQFHLLSADSIKESLKPCDFCYSHTFLQQSPPPVMREMLAACLNSLRPEGIAVFQLFTYKKAYAFNTVDYLAKPQRAAVETHCIPQSTVFSLITDSGCKPLEVREVAEGGARGLAIANTFVVQKSDSKWRRRILRIR